MREIKILFICLLFTAYSSTQTAQSIDFTEINTESTKLQFIPNHKQFHPNVQYLCRLGVTDRVYLEDDGFTFVFHEHQDFMHNHQESNGKHSCQAHGGDSHEDHHHSEEEEEEEEDVLAHSYKVEFVGAQKVIPSGDEKMPHHLNYFLGNDESKWASNVPVYEMAEYKDLYNGIHLKTYSQEGRFKYDFIVEAGADASQIELKYNGVDQIRLHNDELNIPAAGKIIKESKPYAYQIVNGKKKEIACQYTLNGNTVQFEFPDKYDNSIQLIIDPTIIASTITGAPFAGGFGHTAAYDNEGNMYLGGISFGAVYPVTLGAFQTNYLDGGRDISVSKFNPIGTEIIYATYLGSSNRESPHSIIVDNNQQLCVFGTTEGNNYPTTSNAYSPTPNGGVDMVISRISQDGSSLIGSTYMGGNNSDGQNLSTLNTNYGEEYRGEINVDALGNIFIASCTSSPNFPVSSNAFQTELSVNSGTRQDGVVFKMNSDLSVLYWSTFLGADDADVASSLRINDIGEIYVTGTAGDDSFPTTAGSIQAEWPGGQESAFVAVLSSNGANLLRSTFWGTSGIDHSYFLDLDEKNNVHIYGQTTGSMLVTPNTYFATASSRQFISGLTTDLTEVVYSTVIGSGPLSFDSYDFVPVAFMVDKCNNIYFSGYYASSGLPVTNDAILSSPPFQAFYLGVLSPNAEELIFGSYFGNADHVDGGTSRFDKSGIIYQAVCSCFDASLNTTTGAFSENQRASCNAGIFKIDFGIETVTSGVAVQPSGSGCAPYEVDFQYAGDDGVNYFWDFGGLGTSIDKNPSFTFSTAGSYEVMMVAENLNSCNVRDTSFLTIDVLGGSTTETIGLCEESESVFLDASVLGANYAWDNGSTIPTLEVNESGIYWVDISLNGCVSRDSFIVNPIENDFSLGDDISTCSFDNFEINAYDTSIQNYQWNTGQTNAIIDVDQAGDYNITVTDLYGCTHLDTITVTITESLNLDFGPDTTLCQGEILILNPNLGEINYEWQDGSSENTFEVTEPGIYSLSANVGECEVESEINVNYSQLELSLPEIQQLCGDTILSIDAVQYIATNSADFQFQWNTGESSSMIDIDQSGDYNLTITDLSGCTEIDTIAVTITESLNLDFGPDTTLCQGEILILDPSLGEVDYEWQDGSSENIFEITEPGFYSLAANVGACQVESEINIDYSQLEFTLPEIEKICANSELTFDAEQYEGPNSEGVLYQWNTGFIGSELSVNSTSEYWLTVTDIYNCSIVDTIEIQIAEYPDPNLVDITLCPNENQQIDLSNFGSQFVWQDGSTASSFEVYEEGEYWVNITEENCEFRDTFQVSIFDTISVFLEVSDILCPNDLNGIIEVINTTPNLEYTWSNGSSESTIENLGPGTYILETKDSNGCIQTDSVNIDPPSEIGLTTSFSSNDCEGETIGVVQIVESITDNPPVEFFVDGVSYGDTTIISQLGIGNHLIEMIDANNCIVENDFTITSATPNLLDAGEDQEIEIGTSTTIEGSISNSSNMEYSWTPLAVLNCPECISTDVRPTESTNYILSATNLLTGCVLTDDVFIEVKEKESIFIPNIFAPNSFGENNSFSIFSRTERLEVLSLTIFDRWGNLIYESENTNTNQPEQGWDGRYQGQIVQPGVYVYRAEILMDNGEKKLYSGDITVTD